GFCAGHYPPLMRTLQPLLHPEPLSTLPPRSGRPLPLPQIKAASSYPGILLLAGLLRLARHFDESARLLRSAEPPAQWQEARANEEAALAWQRGQAEQALALWEAQPASTAVLFNRGMALLFSDRPAEAQP